MMAFFNGRKKTRILLVALMVMALMVTYAVPMSVFATDGETTDTPPAASSDEGVGGDGGDGTGDLGTGGSGDSGDGTGENGGLNGTGEPNLGGDNLGDGLEVVPAAAPASQGKSTSVKLQNQSEKDISGVTVSLKDGSVIVLQPQGGHWEAKDNVINILGNLEKIVVNFKGGTLATYDYPNDFGHNGTDALITHSSEGDGSVNFFLNKVKGEEPAPKTYAISLEKKVNKEKASPGELVEYTFTIKNTGSGDLKNIKLTDELLNIKGENIANELKPNTTATYTQKYQIPKDHKGGALDNTAVVNGEGKDKEEVSATDTVTVTIEKPEPQKYAISLEKKVNKEKASPGDLVKYTFIITNTGTEPLTNIVLKDKMLNPLGKSIIREYKSLGIGESKEVKGYIDLFKPTGFDYMIPFNYDKDVLENTATVSAIGGGNTVTDEDTATVEIVPAHKIALEKTASPAAVAAGEDVAYTFKITNEGTRTLYDVWLTDPLFGDTWGHRVGKLEPGAETTYTENYTVPSDYEGDTLENTATATGFKDKLGSISEFVLTWILNNTSGDINEIVKSTLSLLKVEDTDSVTVIITNEGPGPVDPTSPAAITLIKTVSPSAVTSKTAEVTYTFEIKNSGDVPLSNVILEDGLIGIWDQNIGDLAAEATTTVAIKFDLSSLGKEGYGQWTENTFKNTATVTGLAVIDEDDSTDFEPTVTATSSATVTYESGGGGNTGGTTRGGGGGGTSPVTIPDEEIPAGPAPDEEEIMMLDEAIPAGALPKTGGTSALLLYGLGALLAGGGLALRRKEK